MMNSAQLRHLVQVAADLASDRQLVLFGSMCVLIGSPDIAETTGLYANTYDADFIPDPWSEELALTMSRAMGKGTSFNEQFGYYADFVRPDAYDNFPPGFKERLVPVEGFENVAALEPHDMAVAKLFAGRDKDVRLLSALLFLGKLDEATLRRRLWDTPMAEKWIVKTHAVLERVVEEARHLTKGGSGAQELRFPPAA